MTAGANHLPKPAIYKLYQRALARWPKDTIRPNAQLQDIVGRRLESEFSTGKVVDEAYHLKQVNALYSLLEDRYKTKVGGPSFNSSSARE